MQATDEPKKTVGAAAAARRGWGGRDGELSKKKKKIRSGDFSVKSGERHVRMWRQDERKTDADTAPPVLVLRLQNSVCVVYSMPAFPWAFSGHFGPLGRILQRGPDDVPAPKTDMDKTCGERGTGGHMFG